MWCGCGGGGVVWCGVVCGEGGEGGGEKGGRRRGGVWVPKSIERYARKTRFDTTSYSASYHQPDECRCGLEFQQLDSTSFFIPSLDTH